jgi:hypothetical protein
MLTNFYGISLFYSEQELMQIESRRTKIEMLKRELGDKYILAPLYGRITDGNDRARQSGMA